MKRMFANQEIKSVGSIEVALALKNSNISLYSKPQFFCGSVLWTAVLQSLFDMKFLIMNE